MVVLGAVAQVTRFEDYRAELLVFLAQRFGSIAFAERLSDETQRRLEEADILPLIGNPRVYLSSYAFSLGLQLLQEDPAMSARLQVSGL